MRLIRPSYEIIEQGPGLQGIYDIIEKCGKVSYKSEAKGGETAKRFVEARAKEGHGAVLEFGTVYLTINDPLMSDDVGVSRTVCFYEDNPYSKAKYIGNNYYITTNYRVLVENNRLDDLKYLCEPTEYHEKRYAVKFITDIGVGREFLRHRVMSMVQESTRYVNYSKEKFGEQCTFVIPPWIDIPECDEVEYQCDSWWRGLVNEKWQDITRGGLKTRVSEWLFALDFAEERYKSLTQEWTYLALDDQDRIPWPAQYAREVLPMATKTEFVLCGFKDAWVHFFRLRSDIAATGKPHPQAQELANPLRDEFIEKGYVTEKDLENDAFGDFDVAISDTNLKP